MGADEGRAKKLVNAVLLATRGDDFEGGEEATPEAPLEDDAWVFETLHLELRVHPMHLVDAEDLALIEAWGLWRGGMGGVAHLPAAGGALDQPCCVIACLREMDRIAELLRPPRPAEGRR